MSDSAEDSDDDFDPQELLIVQELERKEKEAQGEQVETQPKKTFFYNAAGMDACIAQIALPSDFHWVETLSITTPEPFHLDNLQDDLKRESQFYQMSLDGVKEAISRLDESGIPYQRPPDFYAEMVKPDSHMARVKDSLIREKKKMAFTAARKKQREDAKMAKEILAERRKAKGAGKREAKAQLEAIKARKGKRQSEMRVPRTSLTANVTDAQNDEDRRKSKKRQKKDDKFGFGGKKRRNKSNTRDSLNDAPFPVAHNKSQSHKLKMSKKRKKPGKGQKRPGKSARRKNRS